MKSPLSASVPIISTVSVAAAIVLIIFAFTQEPQSPKELAATDVDGDNTPSSRNQAESLPVPRTGEAKRPPQRDLHATIGRLLGNDTPLSTAVQTFEAGLLAYYGEQKGALIWGDPERAGALIDQLLEAEKGGLNSRDYPIVELKSRQQPTVEGDAEREIAYSAVFLAYASDLKVGRLSPRKMDPELFAQAKTIDGAEALSQFATQGDVEGFFKQWAPHNPEYRALRVLLSIHRRIAADGGWPMVSDGETLKPDMRDSRVAALRARLRVSGDITIDGADPGLYDPALVMAVKRFQNRHGLEADGKVGKSTLDALNVPVDERVRQIVLNMERWRWLPENLGDRYILVNIAGFELVLTEWGAIRERMRVIVGKPYRRSPVFSGAIKYLDINPYWTVPYKIAVEDELPQIKRDSNFLQRLGFEVFHKDKLVDPNGVKWASLTKRNFPYTLRQKPGPKNALGRVKFMFPNEFSVYLHDTPSHQLFSRASRAFSSGCIRVQRPIELAETVLQGTDGWDRARIDAVLESEKNTRVNLAKPLPIHLTYSTAWSGEGGTIHFRPDIYGRDTSLHKALFAE